MKKPHLELSDIKRDFHSTQSSSYRGYKTLKEGLIQELRGFYLSPQEKRQRKDTIRVFFKPNDLDFYNLNRKNDYQQSSLNKNATIQEVFLNQKKSEEIFKTVRSKGNIYVNDLWSEDYYKKVMKYAHLQEIISDIKENQRKKTLIKKIQLIDKLKDSTLSSFKKAPNSEVLMEEYLKKHQKTSQKSEKIAEKKEKMDQKKEKMDEKSEKMAEKREKMGKKRGKRGENDEKEVFSADFLREKRGFLQEIIRKCDQENEKHQKERNEAYFPKEKVLKRPENSQISPELAHSLMNFFEIKHKTGVLPSLAKK